MRTESEQIFQAIKKAERILVVFNRAWPGDAVASALALRAMLEKMNKTVDIAAETPSAISPYTFLPGFAKILPELANLRKFIISLNIKKGEVGQIEYRRADDKLDFIISPKSGFFTNNDVSSRSSGFKYDLIIALSTPDLESLGSLYDQDTEFFFETTIINIDHEPGNENFGQINVVNVNAVATAEMLYELFKDWKIEMDADIATCLLAGLIIETKSFKTANVSPKALTIASDLINQNARREEIINVLYRSRQLNVLKLWGSVLTGLKSRLENRLVWSSIRSEDFIATETKPSDLSDVVDELMVSLPQAQVIVLVYEIEDSETGKKTVSALIESLKNIDALYLAQPYSAKGTKRSVEVNLTGDLQTAGETLVASIEEKMKRLES